MRLKDLLTDDGAVSPVIGVILMVAITVILAAVIASFVLGLGNQSGEVAPQGSLALEYDNSTSYGSFDGNLTVTHDTGDPIEAEEVYLRGEEFDDSEDTWAAYNSSGYSASISGTSEGRPAIVAGDRLEVGANSTYDIRVVWEPTEGTNSATLATDEGPDA